MKSRFHIFIVIVVAILTIILSIVYLTVIGKFDISTFAFLLGTGVGSKAGYGSAVCFECRYGIIILIKPENFTKIYSYLEIIKSLGAG